MSNRLELQEKLEELLGSKNVYYQPPESVVMNYPAICYSKMKPDVKHADNGISLNTNCYEIIVISKRPDEPVIDEIEKLQNCQWDRHYKADNLNHDVLTLYY